MTEEIKDIDTVEQEAEEKTSEDSAPVEERVVIFEEALEAILFAAGHPISYATLARVFDMTPGKVKDKVFEYSLKYNDPAIPRGVILLTYGDSCQLSTKQYYLNEIRDTLGIKKSGSLSTSSMEALAIVAYNQPVTRIFVDTLRRADSSYAMNNLLDRGLIEAQGRLDAPGRPMLYGTTPDFLRVFGLKDISELPTTSEEITDMFAKGKNVEDTEEAVQEEMKFPELEGKDGSDSSTEATDAQAPTDSFDGESAEDGVYGTDSPDESAEDDVYGDDEELVATADTDDVYDADELEESIEDEPDEEDEAACDELDEEDEATCDEADEEDEATCDEADEEDEATCDEADED